MFGRIMNLKTTFSFNQVGRIQLDGAENGNRFGTEDLHALAEALEQLASRNPAVIVLEAAGEDFCLGRDPGGDHDPAALRASLATVLEIGDRIRRLPTLVLAAVQGRALGLGAGLVLHSDLAIAGAGARLAFDEVERGFPPTLVMTYIERYLPRKIARELLVTGRELGAEEGLGFGVFNRVVADDALAQTVDALAEQLAAKDHDALTACKPFLTELEGLPAAEHAEHGLEAGVAFFGRLAAAKEAESDHQEKE